MTGVGLRAGEKSPAAVAAVTHPLIPTQEKIQ